MVKDLESVIGGVAVIGLSALLGSQLLPGQFDDAAMARNPLTFPRFLLALFALGGIGLLLRGLLAHGTEAVWPRVAWPKMAGIAVVAGLYFWAFQPVGYLPASLVFLPVALLVLGYRNAVVIVLVTLITVPLLWYVFAAGFTIRPPGYGMDDLLRAAGVQ